MNFGCGLREDQLAYLECLARNRDAWQEGAVARAEGLGRKDCGYLAGPPKREWLNGWRAIDKALKESRDEA